MKIEYREFKTGEAVAEYYSADYIVAIVPIENGFGVFSKAVSIDSIKSMIWGTLPGSSCLSNENDNEDLAILEIDLSQNYYGCEYKVALQEYLKVLASYTTSNGDKFYDKIYFNGSTITAINSRLKDKTQNDIQYSNSQGDTSNEV